VPTSTLTAVAGADGLVEQANAALEAGDVETALARLRTAIERDDDPHAHALLGGIAYMDDRFDDARREWEHAFAALRRADEPQAAARVAIDLAELHASTLGNNAAGNGWANRARRLLEQVGRCSEWGHLELAFMACDRPDVDELLASAQRALAIAAEFDDVALEVRALADSGLALVSQGRVRDGFDRLDAALAAIAAGEVHDMSAVGKSFCSMLSSCDRVGDVHRAEEWTNLVQAMVLDRFEGRPRVLHTHCLAAYGSVLCRAGRWPEAESAMNEVLGPNGSQSFGHRADTAATLALLRVEQGRLDEAAALLAPYEDHISACVPIACLHLRRKEPASAAAVVRRGLGELVGDALRGATLLSLLVEAELAAGDVDAAREAAARLAVIAGDAESTALAAEADVARGRVAAAMGDHVAAIDAFESARRRLASGERPLLAALARLELAEALAASGQAPSAVAEARAALATFERLGATSCRDRALALLRELGVGVRLQHRSGAELLASLTARESEVLDLVRQGCSNAEIAARLYISPKTAEHHVGRILGKLGVRSRAEAAALAATSVPRPEAAR
jgi:DNA-binding CsgD family transcriptional regulator/Tfp pilus assembly protein PilF